MRMKNFDLPANFLSYLDNGKLTVTCDGEPTINFRVDGSTKIIDVIDIPIEITKMPGFLKQLSEAKELAKDLAKKKTTIEVHFKGEPVLKLGEKANPKLAKIVTRSSDIEITDIRKLKKLSDVF
ncbi:hypothetical protein NMSP_0947 [Candidatus Nitrosomarinus catalina]|jgi:hypothetical protein|uniref:Uncharacterized protein n=2 Tax=Candidatus Nitrosomarinus catalinensis TaxID=1898749 RepID=A0A2Z2HPV5_9ARCH|nr:hypothetical protein NMSP_0947 [Candidatus Nitrosomarinus catalina]